MREIFIERRIGILRVAIKENNELIECHIEEDNKEPISGQIYKGIIKRVVPSIKAIFVDIGFEKDAYMPLDERTKNLKVGHNIIVEIMKEEIGKKGAKISTLYSIAGNFIVLETKHKSLVISRKIQNRGFEKEIKSILKKPDEIGVTIRTKGQNKGIYEIQKELNNLYEVYCNIQNKAKFEIKPCKLYDNKSLINRIIKDFATGKETKKIIVDNESDFDFLNETKDAENIIIEFHKEARTLFAYEGLEKQILSLRNNKVNLKCGGNIVIEKTEAMYSIDVNTAKNNSSTIDNTTADITNIEAAKEIAKQIKLRNLSGIIIIDFIESFNELAKEKIINILNFELTNEKQKSKIFDFTELGLVQIARTRRGKSIYEFIEEDCTRCKGNGKNLKLSYIYLLLKNEILRWKIESSVKDFHICLNRIYEKEIRENIFVFLKEIDALNINIYLTFEDFEEFYKIEPLIFKNQIENVKNFLVKNIEKY